MATLQKGENAPSFTLYDSDKNAVSLESFRGKPVILLFFPFAFTSVCTEELCSVRDNMAAYNQIGASVLGISVDSPFTLKKFKEAEQLNFPLLSDFNKEVSAAYGALHENFAFDLKGVSKRAAFLVDGNGVLRHVEVLENPGHMPDFGALREAVSSLS